METKREKEGIMGETEQNPCGSGSISVMFTSLVIVRVLHQICKPSLSSNSLFRVLFVVILFCVCVCVCVF